VLSLQDEETQERERVSVRVRDDETTRRRDDETTRRRDDETTRRRDDETTRRRDDETTRRRDDETTRRRDDETTRRRDDETTTEETRCQRHRQTTYVPVSEDLLPKVRLNFPGKWVAGPEILPEERPLRRRVHAVGDDAWLPGSLASPREGPRRPQGRRYDTYNT
jgi:hypothetical protein